MITKLVKLGILNLVWRMGYQLNLRREVREYPVELSLAECAIIDYVLDNELTMVSFDQIISTAMACKWVVKNSVPGDFVECGVWRGGNAIVAAEIFRLNNADNHVWLFDTFNGMVSPTDIDMDYNGVKAIDRYMDDKKIGYNEWCYASIEHVKANFMNKGLLKENIHFVPGDVNETLNEPLGVEKISVLRLDTDWWESTKIELEILYPKLSIGGVLIIDDYGSWLGCRTATDEYFAKTTRRPYLGCSGNGSRVGIKT
jgi:hypothetical protein